MVLQSVSTNDHFGCLSQSDEGAGSGVQLQGALFIECDRHAQHALFHHHWEQDSIVAVIHFSEHGVSLSHFTPSVLFVRSPSLLL